MAAMEVTLKTEHAAECCARAVLAAFGELTEPRRDHQILTITVPPFVPVDMSGHWINAVDHWCRGFEAGLCVHDNR